MLIYLNNVQGIEVTKLIFKSFKPNFVSALFFLVSFSESFMCHECATKILSFFKDIKTAVKQKNLQIKRFTGLVGRAGFEP